MYFEKTKPLSKRSLCQQLIASLLLKIHTVSLLSSKVQSLTFKMNSTPHGYCGEYAWETQYSARHDFAVL